MIAGFGGSSDSKHQHFEIKHSSDLPIPFNIPIVLHNLLFEDNGIEFDAKQADIIETLKFSYISLAKIQQKFAVQEADLKAKIFSESDNIQHKIDYEEIQLDRQQANYDFKSLVELISDMLSREQFQKLLKFSNIAV